MSDETATTIEKPTQTPVDDLEPIEEEKTNFVGMEATELIAHIARLDGKRKELRRKAATALEMLQERSSELPASAEVEEAKKTVAMAVAKLNRQKDEDSDFKNLETKLKEVSGELSDIEGSLSDALVTYMVQTQSKTVHIDPMEPESTDREIKTFARIGKKVPAQLDMFDQKERVNGQ